MTNWPERSVIVRLTAKSATNIRKAFDSSMDGDAIATAWEQTHPAGGSVTPQTARDWALAHVIVNKKPLQVALAKIYADGYVTGEKVAKIRLLGLQKSVTAGVVDWSNWVPGLPAAAALVKPKGGLRTLLDNDKIRVADEVVNTKLDRIGTALSASLDKGWSADKTASTINEVINDPQHALVIARTEMARAVSLATRDTYKESGVEKVEWLVADGCDICQENADASPIGLDEEFPSGDTEPPAHPNCECAISPYFDDQALDEVPLDEEPEPFTFDFGDAQEVSAEDVSFEEIAPIEVEQPQYPKSLPLEEVLSIAKPGTSPIHVGKGDVWLSEIQDRLGFNGLPTLVNSKEELNGLVSKGWTKMYRGIARGEGLKEEAIPRAIQDFKTGPNYAGEGMYGNGTYASTKLMRALEYSKDKTENVLHMALAPDAKIINSGDAQELRVAELAQLYKERGYKDGNEFWKASPHEYEMITNLGRWAASKGYDAIKVQASSSEDFYVILNRTKVAVLK